MDKEKQLTAEELNLTIKESDLRAIIGTAIYKRLLDIEGKGGLSVPCKIRTNIEEDAINEVVQKLKSERYASQKEGVSRELLETQKEYIELLDKALSESNSIAFIHHYKPSEEDINKGRELRDKIKSLESHPKQLIDKDKVIEELEKKMKEIAKDPSRMFTGNQELKAFKKSIEVIKSL